MIQTQSYVSQLEEEIESQNAVIEILWTLLEEKGGGKRIGKDVFRRVVSREHFIWFLRNKCQIVREEEDFKGKWFSVLIEKGFNATPLLLLEPSCSKYENESDGTLMKVFEDGWRGFAKVWGKDGGARFLRRVFSL